MVKKCRALVNKTHLIYILNFMESINQKLISIISHNQSHTLMIEKWIQTFVFLRKEETNEWSSNWVAKVHYAFDIRIRIKFQLTCFFLSFHQYNLSLKICIPHNTHLLILSLIMFLTYKQGYLSPQPFLIRDITSRFPPPLRFLLLQHCVVFIHSSFSYLY